MAVQQTKKSRRRRDMRRAHDALKFSAIVQADPVTGETHRRHHVSKDGYYKGREILKASEADKKEEKTETEE